MSVYLPAGCRTFCYDFQWRGRRYLGTTHQTRREDAVLVESQLKIRIRQQAAGIAAFDPKDSPRFQDWAEVYLQYQRRYTDRPDIAKRALLVVLEFWGSRPAKPRRAPVVRRRHRVEPPYHDLCLGDPIADPSWIRRFDEWIDARRVSGSTRNTYLSTLSGLYRVAMDPQYRQDSNVTINPFRDIRRSPQGSRSVALEPEAILRWVQEASYHIALTATIAALAPKLRLGTILALQWKEHLDDELTRITIHRHKTSRRTGAPQITPISDQLREVLLDARARTPADCTHVVNWRGRPVSSVKTGTRRAVRAIGLPWGVRDGVTFHTIRHSIATLLAKMGLSERIRMELMGHAEIRTTQRYTHLAASTQVDPHEQLSALLPIGAVVTGKPHQKEPSRVLRMPTRRRSA